MARVLLEPLLCVPPRWMHAVCDHLFTEEEVEQAADEGFDCTSCQPYVIKPVGESWDGPGVSNQLPHPKQRQRQQLINRGRCGVGN